MYDTLVLAVRWVSHGKGAKEISLCLSLSLSLSHTHTHTHTLVQIPRVDARAGRLTPVHHNGLHV
jgi:hypothetical protein